MTSLEDRMRANRQVLAGLTEAERASLYGIPELAHELRNEIDALAATAKRMHTALNRAGRVLLTISFVAGAGGAVALMWLSEWIGSLFR